MTARRIQLRRTKGWRRPEGAIVVARPTKWGNPFRGDRATVVALYREHLAQHPELVADERRELVGRDLACWCPLDQPCHADVLIAIANAEAPC